MNIDFRVKLCQAGQRERSGQLRSARDGQSARPATGMSKGARVSAPSQKFTDIIYEVDGPAAIITINRPERYNAFRGQTVEEMVKAFRSAWADRQVQAVILTGAGNKAFCTGGDVKQRAETGDYGPTESGMFEIGYLQWLIRDIPKPASAP